MLIEEVTLYDERLVSALPEPERYCDLSRAQALYHALRPAAERIGPDPRLAALSPQSREAITALFGRDVDEASAAAERLHLFARPPAWAAELRTATRLRLGLV